MPLLTVDESDCSIDASMGVLVLFRLEKVTAIVPSTCVSSAARVTPSVLATLLTVMVCSRLSPAHFVVSACDTVMVAVPSPTAVRMPLAYCTAEVLLLVTDTSTSLFEVV